MLTYMWTHDVLCARMQHGGPHWEHWMMHGYCNYMIMQSMQKECVQSCCHKNLS